MLHKIVMVCKQYAGITPTGFVQYDVLHGYNLTHPLTGGSDKRLGPASKLHPEVQLRKRNRDPHGKDVVDVAPVQFRITTKDPAITGYIMSRLPDNYIGMRGGVFQRKRASGKNNHNWTQILTCIICPNLKRAVKLTLLKQPSLLPAAFFFRALLGIQWQTRLSFCTL